jgi:hypothetical protein
MQALEEKLKLQRSSLPLSLPPTPQRSHKDQPPLVSHKLPPKKNTKISSFSLNQREEGDDDDDDECARKEGTQIPLRLVIFSEVAVSPNNNNKSNKSNKNNKNQITVHSTSLDVLTPQDFLWFPFCPIFLALTWLPPNKKKELNFHQYNTKKFQTFLPKK